ncbi:amino acid/amide ABC transporter substrate-binding protein, HAAT family [Ectothiorhodosinus mongolicus]|uniref:Amino acid/amide ABC transporter substrate-binding protein, HAAT family n=2 Tax=Ectothiorhodosinus mongolicus TaxID=233100 RepID=A0A1R3W9I5_9GAMM|nr:amino acid ABC transporter substrate-binding protein [Ectothiorhodosinus mongolicus]SIT72851.1 amino acid/amide ABC transporter substrate-binding protein, HAAT family [Ectothiorhodosinus mongolicus]
MNNNNDGAKRRDTRLLGVLFSQTGVLSIIEKTQQRAAMLALHEINEAGGILGSPLRAISYDAASRIPRYGELAEELMVRDGVKIMIGCYASSARKEVLPIVERHNGILFYPTLYEGFEYSSNVIYGGATPNQNSVPLAQYMTRNYGSRCYFVGSDYIYPRESNRVMRHIIRELGGEVVGERYLPLKAKSEQYKRIIEDIKKTRPEFIFSTVVGTGTVIFYQAYHEAFASVSRAPICSLTTSEAEIYGMGAAAARGHITAAPYFQNLPTESSQRFVARYRALYGDDAFVTSCGEAAYSQVHMLSLAMEQAASHDVADIRSALYGISFMAPQGPVRVDPENNHTYLHSRIAKVGDNCEYEVVSDLEVSIKPDPYLVVPNLNEWGDAWAMRGSPKNTGSSMDND